MSDERQLTVILVPHGRETTRTYELSYRRLRLLGILAGTVVFVLLMMVGSWLYLAGQAARVPGLKSQVRSLQRDRSRVDSLARTLEGMSDEYAKVRQMLGADSAALPRIDSTEAGPAADSSAGTDPAAAPRASLPRHWPLAEPGFVTRGHLARLPGRHPGMDIAVARGSRILAAGAGTVAEVGEDSVYGRYVRIAHREGYESLYAHASRLLVRAQEPVVQDQVIALSGSTGVSTAPHLHFEIRKDGLPVDPRGLLRNPN